ncbi:MAG: putative bifunctional diguanylate cyclase/phosphodiesterase [Nakamurella sp.]
MAVSYRCSIEHPDSSLRIALIDAKPIIDKDGVTAGWVGTLSDVTAQARAESVAAEAQCALERLNIELAATARRDPLTGLGNRLALKEDLELLEARVTRYGHRYSVALLDIDHFKSYNDTYGHQAGDVALRAVAAHLHEQSRGGDVLYRYGGEEFLCVFPEQDLAAGVAAAQRMRVGVAQLAIAHAENAGGVVTLSGGVATLEPGGLSSVKEVLKDADDALYRAKQRGRNRIEPLISQSGAAGVSGPKSSETAKTLSVGELRDAIAAGQLEVYYQPVVHLRTGGVLSAEALVRWNHPHRGLVGPADFIPFAEESGLIADLTDVVIDEVLQQTAAWATAGRPLKCAVNLSARLLSDAAQTAPLLARLAANADAVSVEVTESALADDAALMVLRELADCGVEIALDDFGTGYSSLARLKDMPVTVLKIDRAFVHNLDHDGRDVAIIQMIAHLAEALGLDVIAEGIETQNTAELLRASGISQGQGYLYARPMPLSEFENWAATARAAATPIGEDGSAPGREQTTTAHAVTVEAESVDVTQVLLDSTRSLLRATSSEQAVDALIRAVADLGGTYIPATQAPATVIPIDISLGHADPLLLMAPDGSWARSTIEHVLPALVEDARVAADAAVRHARLSEQTDADLFAGEVNRPATDREPQSICT